MAGGTDSSKQALRGRDTGSSKQALKGVKSRVLMAFLMFGWKGLRGSSPAVAATHCHGHSSDSAAPLHPTGTL